MRQVKISSWLTNTVVCLLLLAAGCAPLGEEVGKTEAELEKQIPEVKAEKAATIALKFSPQDSTTYRVIEEAERGIKWEGPLPEDSTFESGHNHNRIEMTFTQQIQSVDDEGNAIVKITVKELKRSSTVKNKPAVELDSSKIKNPNHPLAKLIGQSYTIKIAPTGEVIGVIDAQEARTEVRKGSEPPIGILRLLNAGAIMKRHGTLILPDTDINQLYIGDSWSIIKNFSFGMMGSKSFEKIYTLNKIEDRDNRRVAIIKMDAIPALETTKEPEAVDFAESYDNTETYTGELEFDLTNGKVEKYLEKLNSEWIIILPTVEQEADKEPPILIMSDSRLYNIEKID